MRFFVASLAALASIAHGQYCAAGPTSAQDSNLGEVILKGDSKDIDNVANCPGQTGTQDHTDEIADLVVGNSYTLEYHVTTCGGPYNRASAAWIDWDGDGVFDDNEQLGEVLHTTDTPDSLKSVAFVVPAGGAVPGTRLRVMVQESSATVLTPCAVFAYGGVKDFGINVITSSASGLSGGSIFLIVVPVLAIFYFAGGFAWGHKLGKEGNDRILHKEFWTDFPSYVATGFSVTLLATKGAINKLKGGGAETTDYEEY